jgi:hypothetical protein
MKHGMQPASAARLVAAYVTPKSTGRHVIPVIAIVLSRNDPMLVTQLHTWRRLRVTLLRTKDRYA